MADDLACWLARHDVGVEQRVGVMTVHEPVGSRLALSQSVLALGIDGAGEEAEPLGR